MTGRHIERGQAMTEVALLMLIFLAFFIGIIDWAWTMYAHEALVSRATRAARWAAVRPITDANVAAMKDMILFGVTPCSGCDPAFGLTADNIAVTTPVTSYTENNGTAVSIPTVVVTISGYAVSHFTPVLGGSFTGRPITASVVSECVNTACSAP